MNLPLILRRGTKIRRARLTNCYHLLGVWMMRAVYVYGASHFLISVDIGCMTAKAKSCILSCTECGRRANQCGYMFCNMFWLAATSTKRIRTVQTTARTAGKTGS